MLPSCTHDFELKSLRALYLHIIVWRHIFCNYMIISPMTSGGWMQESLELCKWEWIPLVDNMWDDKQSNKGKIKEMHNIVNILWVFLNPLLYFTTMWSSSQSQNVLTLPPFSKQVFFFLRQQTGFVGYLFFRERGFLLGTFFLTKSLDTCTSAGLDRTSSRVDGFSPP